MLYVGIDLHKEIHTAVMLDCWNAKLGEITIENKPAEFHKPDRDYNNAERSESTKERRKRESIYRCDKYARTHEGCNADGCKESVYKSILVKIK